MNSHFIEFHMNQIIFHMHFLINFFHLVWLFWDLSILLYVSIYQFQGEYISICWVFRSEILQSYGNCCLIFKKLPNCFPKWLYHFTFFPAVFSEFLLILWFQFMFFWLLIMLTIIHVQFWLFFYFVKCLFIFFADIFIILFKLIIELWELFVQHFNICVVLILSAILWLDIFYFLSGAFRRVTVLHFVWLSLANSSFMVYAFLFLRKTPQVCKNVLLCVLLVAL